MAIFDAAIFDGPPSSTIFDTGAAVPVPRDPPPLSQAQVHGTQGSGSVHGTEGSASVHDTKGIGRVTN